MAFWSYASNLVSGDGSPIADVFVRDWSTSNHDQPAGGGSLSAWGDGTAITFPSGTFGSPVVVTFSALPEHTWPAGRSGGHQPLLDLSGVYAGTSNAAQPTVRYVLTIQYTMPDQRVIESHPGVVLLVRRRLVKEPTGVLNAATNTITAQPDHFSSWTVLGQSDRRAGHVCTCRWFGGNLARHG